MTYLDLDRGTGRTTAQMRGMPIDGIFIWCNDILHYPQTLAHRIGRDDLHVLPSSAAKDGASRLRGLNPGIVAVDHDLRLTQSEWNDLRHALQKPKPGSWEAINARPAPRARPIHEDPEKTTFRLLVHAERWRAEQVYGKFSRAEPFIRGHELPPYIVTFDGLTLPYGSLGL